MFGWLFKKREVEGIEEDTRRGFDSVKNDMQKVNQWINHLNTQDKNRKKEIEEINDKLSTLETDIDGLKNVVELLNSSLNSQLFKTPKQLLNKQTAVEVVQTAVQTAVQTGDLYNFNNLSVMERAIVFTILNSGEMKLSYEDIAALLQKEKSTIRGQINAIRQKCPGLIEELAEKSGKKRVFIPENIRSIYLKSTKMRVKGDKK